MKGSDNPPNQVSAHRGELDPAHPTPVEEWDDDLATPDRKGIIQTLP